MEIQRKDEVRGELLREIFSIQEEERRRIARELHDETSQALSSLNANLEAALGILPSGTDKVKARLKEAQAISISILDDIHKLIYELRPSMLDDLGLVPAVRWLADVNLVAAGIKVSVSIIGKERRLSPQLETTLFRIIKEAISNITRHAHARNASLSLHFQKHTITAHIQNDGRGFDVEEAINSKDRPRGLGLLGMKERVELMSGTLDIRSHPGKRGTEITIEIPIKQEVTLGENKNTGGR
ncbi:MAG: sensor histidine kinase [Chloroflexi bacterium]|nr:sensor histidine kinase [Chloroflexota bacterium]MBI2980073.1 sensor histidine kinase [Chloroflexota bacterium]